jgi:predicted nucleic acid-binding protein
MIFFPDTNWLVAAYFLEHDDARTRQVQRFTAAHHGPWVISALVELEAKNVFARIAQQPNGSAWRAFTADIGQRLHLEPLDWQPLRARAFNLSERFSHKLAIGSLDLAIVAHAELCRATHFLSFDTASSARALAAALRMQIVPPLTPADQSRLAALRR